MAMRPPVSALDPAAGSGAALIDQLGYVLYVGAAIIFVVVMALVVYAVLSRTRPVNSRLWILGGGLAFPIVALTLLLTYSLAVGNGLSAIGSFNALQLFLDCFGIESVSKREIANDGVLRIHVVGKQWWWEVRYQETSQRNEIVLANEIRMPTGRAVELVLSSTDVIHSFWVPSLAGKVDMIPGRITRLRLHTTEQGTYRALCAEYCGGQHALMAMYVVTQDPAEFEAWLERQALPASEPTDAFLKMGHDAFFRGECHECHTIRGTPANGTSGPDLTHIGGRKSLAAGTLDNHIGTLAGWIAGAQDVKPGNKMPSSLAYTGVELRALAAWLGSLE
jgi:cytochrome c oxidase subunit 2